MVNARRGRRGSGWCTSVLVCCALASAIGCGAGAPGAGAPGPSPTAGKTFAGSLSVGSQPATQTQDCRDCGGATGGLALRDQPLAPASLKVVCTGVDGSQASAPVDATGAFSVDVRDLPNPVVCDVLTAGDVHYATFLFATDQRALDGSSLRADALSITGNVDVGSVTVDTAAGEAPADGVIAKGAAVAPFDPTGEYTVAAPADVPAGYVGPCPAGAAPDTCHGPRVGDTMYVRLLTGKAFTPDAACAGRAAARQPVTSCGGQSGDDPAYAVLLWSSKAAFEACGARLGFSFDEAKAYAGIDLTGSSVAEGAPAWSTALPDGKRLLPGGWRVEEATAEWDIADCSGKATDDGVHLWICHDRIHDTYNVGSGGGCQDASGHDVLVEDWSSLGAPTSCTTAGETVSVAGERLALDKNVCTYANGDVCTSEGATFTRDASGRFVAAPDAVFDYQNGAVLLPRGGSCGDDALAGHELARLQCYANAYFPEAQALQHDARVCMRDVRTDWGAQDAAAFVVDTGPARAVAQFAAERADFPAPGLMHFFHEQDDFAGVPSGPSSWQACHTRERLSISVRQLPSTSALEVRYVQETVLIDAHKPACAAAAQRGQLGVGSVRGVFDFVR